MKEIPLTQGKVALVDDEDFDTLIQFKWCILRHDHTCYAMCHMKEGRKCRTIYMHRLILGAATGVEVDHKDCDGLNNMRSNLRLATKSQNYCNGRKREGTTSQYKGVCWDKSKNKWLAHVNQYGKCFFLGYFNNEIDAAQAYNKAASERFGEFTRLNRI